MKKLIVEIQQKVFLLSEITSHILLVACSVSMSECTQLFTHEKNGRHMQTQIETKWRRLNAEDQN